MVDPAPAYSSGRSAVAAVVGVTVLVALLVTWGASIGPGTVLDGEGIGPLTVPTSADACPSGLDSPGVVPDPTVPASCYPTTASPGPASGGQERGGPSVVLQVLAVALVGLGAGLLLALLGFVAVALWRLRPQRRPRRERVDFEVVDAPDSADAVAAAIAADAARQLAVLREGTPRNGIVAAWARFEEQAAEAGVRPQPWETSSEFALRILELVEADTSAVAALAVLFREARFSEHEVTEAMRQRALDLLADIHASLGRGRAGVRR